MAAALDAATGGDKDQRIFVRGDKTVAYGEVMELMNLLRDAGYLKIALVGLDAGQGSDNPDATDQNAAQPAGGKASP